MEEKDNQEPEKQPSEKEGKKAPESQEKPAEKGPDEQEQQEKLIPRVIEDEMKESYLAYSMSVIVGRALPDVRDGLKPVHRRILYAMYDMGMLHNKPFKKSARIVGEVLGKYHPHGDTAVYDAMVRMVQDFSLRYTLVQGQGNFGSIDGDNAAAMRYTEARLKSISEDMLQDIDKETVDFMPNFDGSLKEPAVLPSKIPNLLVNGSSGIAVGMATNIPPHNMAEICDGITSMIDNPDITVDELMKTVKGPDFPTGGIIMGTEGIRNAFKTGRGRIRIKARTSVEEHKGKPRIIVTEIPYQVNKAMLLEQIAGLVKDKKLTGISDLRDESDKDGMRVVIELRSGANKDVVLNQLLKHTRLQQTFGVIMLALVEQEPRVLGIRGLIQQYIRHRKDVVRKRTQFDLRKAEERAHILEGLLVALEDIDNIIKKIKASRTVQSAQTSLMKDYKLTEVQAKAILDMKLQKLASLEVEKTKKEHEDLMKLIAELKEILASEARILEIIKKELEEIRSAYQDDRKTEVSLKEEKEIAVEDLIKKEDMVITVTHAGYVKRLPTSTYRAQKRGGRGVIAAGRKEEDFVEHLFVANTHAQILFFTNKGKVHWLKVHMIPEAGRGAKGTPLVNLISLEQDERITAFVPIDDFSKGFLMMATSKGTVKKSSLDLFANPRRGGIIAIKLSKDDELISVRYTEGSNQLILATKEGMAVRFKESDCRPMGRTAAGVRGIRLKKADDAVVGMVVAEKEKTFLTVTEKGFGKRTPVEDYRLVN
ncbi:DNA gyrase subunit A, partial [Candidatus Woesearchaeota archaeon]|nr:DNA gyrase subunit A [Candidatus Woesearchaeota archaeon]